MVSGKPHAKRTSEHLYIRVLSQGSLRGRKSTVLRSRLFWAVRSCGAASQARHSPNPSKAIFYCIHIDEVTGRRATPDPVPEEEMYFHIGGGE